MAIESKYRPPVSEKLCKRCGLVKSKSDYYPSLSHYSGLQHYCKKCTMENIKEYDHASGRHSDFKLDTTTALHLGVHIAENTFATFFPDAIRSKFNTRGYDFLIGGDNIKIDVKASCLRSTKGYTRQRWRFNTRKINKIVAEYELQINSLIKDDERKQQEKNKCCNNYKALIDRVKQEWLTNLKRHTRCN
jgi:hypothetical protein